MAKVPIRRTYGGIPAARTPIDPLDPTGINFDPKENLEPNEGETNETENINRTEIVNQKHQNKYKRKETNKQ